MRPLNEITRDLLHTQLGREFLRALWDACGNSTETFTKCERSDTFARGKKSIGVRLENIARNENFDMYLLTLREGDSERANAAEKDDGEKYESI